MNGKKIFISVLCLLIILGGNLICFGYQFDINVFTKFYEDGIMASPISGIMFIIIGVLLLLIEGKFLLYKKVRPMLISFFTISLFFIIFISSYSLLTFIDFFKFDKIIDEEIFKSYPSIFSLFVTFLIATRGLMYIFDTNKLKFVRWLGILIGAISLSDLVGHIFNSELLYFRFSESFSGLPVNIAILSLLSSFILILNSFDKNCQNGYLRKNSL